jgi:pSer/pThr/pTyr-binding forkhead associated (FHA) protein
MRLEVVAGNAAGATIVVEDELIIGRLADGDGRLGDDDEISRSHARVALDADGTYAIEDLGSTNGTFVNGLRIPDPQGLVEGDTIELGSTTLVVREIQPAPAPEPASQPTLISEGLFVAPAEAGAEPAGEDLPQPALGDIPQPVADDIRQPALEDLPEPVGEPTIESISEEIPQPAGPPPTLAVRVEVDFAARAARILVGDGADPVRLELVDGTWRAVPPAD